MTIKWEWEDRKCGACGKPWEALHFWDADSVCGDCASAAYLERLRSYSEAKPYTVEGIGGACPTQAQGMTPTGMPYYFRARHGEWSLEVGKHGWPVDLLKWPGEGEWIAGGLDDTGGWMDDDQVLAILDAHLI